MIQAKGNNNMINYGRYVANKIISKVFINEINTIQYGNKNVNVNKLFELLQAEYTK